MLLTIHNLPANASYNSIKNLIIEKCGFSDLILDNLVSDGASKKVTIGLGDEGDAAILVRKINGLYFGNTQLYVEDIRKKKASEQPYRRTTNMIREERSGYENSVGISQQLQNDNQYQQNYNQQMMMPLMSNYGMQRNTSFMPQLQNSSFTLYDDQLEHQESVMSQMLETSVSEQNNRINNNRLDQRSNAWGIKHQQDTLEGVQINHNDLSLDYIRAQKYSDRRVSVIDERNQSNHKSGYSNMSSQPHSTYQIRDYSDSNLQYNRENSKNLKQSQTSTCDALTGSLYSDFQNEVTLQHSEASLRSQFPQSSQHLQHFQDSPTSQAPQRSQASPHAQALPYSRFPQSSQAQVSSRSQVRQYSQVPPRSQALPRSQLSIQNRRNRGTTLKQTFNRELDYEEPKGKIPRKNNESNLYSTYVSPRNNPVSLQPKNSKLTEPKQIRSKDLMIHKRRSRNQSRPGVPTPYMGKKSARNLNKLVQKNKNDPIDKWTTHKVQLLPEPLSKGYTNSKVNKPQTGISANSPIEKRHIVKDNHTSRAPFIDTGVDIVKSDTAEKKGAIKISTLINKDQTWRSQVTSRIAKEITAKHMKSIKNSEFEDFFKLLKQCIKTRIDIILGDKFAVPPDQIYNLYRKKFPTALDRVFYETVVQKKDHSVDKMTPGEKGVVTHKSLETRTQLEMMNTATATVPADMAMSIPNYPIADQKKLHSEMSKDPGVYKLPQKDEAVLNEELDVIGEMFEKESETVENEEERLIIKQSIHPVVTHFKKVVVLNVTKRILNIRTNLSVRIIGNTQLPKKDAVICFLADYGLVDLKKSEMQEFYFANLDSYENYDRLCALENATIEGYKVSFKPLHISGPLEIKVRVNRVRKHKNQNKNKAQLDKEAFSCYDDFDPSSMDDLIDEKSEKVLKNTIIKDQIVDDVIADETYPIKEEDLEDY